MSRNGNSITPNDFINLKNRVKNEMNRRNGYGSLTNYGTTTYDFTNTPKSSDVPNLELFTKTRDVMTNINPTKVSLNKKLTGDVTDDITILEANMTAFESQPRYAQSNNDCATNCTGMCITTCSTTCDGCSGCSGCSTACSTCTNCTSACAIECNGDCTSVCSSVCGGTT